MAGFLRFRKKLADPGYANGLTLAVIALGNFKLDFFAFVQCLETIRLDSRVMNKDVLTRFLLNEAVTFRRIKPFYRSLYQNLQPPMFLKRPYYAA